METYGWFKTEFDNAKDSIEYKLEGLELLFTEKILAIMEERGINRSELAKKIGSSKAYISKLLKNGSNMTLKSMLTLAEALDCSIKIDIVEKISDYKTVSYSTIQQGFSYPYQADDYFSDNEDNTYAATCY